ncbi:MAG: hypothetical protein K0S08_419 [Gammaproteobacteria bacterium]|jgi:hypothetical protein|nr:hypothetical protein [Gammaproteobacteria bacterium]
MWSSYFSHKGSELVRHLAKLKEEKGITVTQAINLLASRIVGYDIPPSRVMLSHTLPPLITIRDVTDTGTIAEELNRYLKSYIYAEAKVNSVELRVLRPSLECAINDEEKTAIETFLKSYVSASSAAASAPGLSAEISPAARFNGIL